MRDAVVPGPEWKSTPMPDEPRRDHRAVDRVQRRAEQQRRCERPRERFARGRVPDRFGGGLRGLAHGHGVSARRRISSTLEASAACSSSVSRVRMARNSQSSRARRPVANSSRASSVRCRTDLRPSRSSGVRETRPAAFEYGHGRGHRLRPHTFGAGEVAEGRRALAFQAAERRELRPGEVADRGLLAETAHQATERDPEIAGERRASRGGSDAVGCDLRAWGHVCNSTKLFR